MDLELGEYFLHIYIIETSSLALTDVKDIKLRVKSME